MAKIYDICDIPEAILQDVGGKARGLNRLIHFGFDVPEAFIVTDIGNDDDLSQVCEKYTASGFGEVSVRSSATLEDGKDFSAAGQFSTVLNINGEENVLQAVRNCVDSLNSYTAKQYSKVFLKSGENRMTVVVQKMVNPRCAGVIFSNAPLKPDHVLIEAVPGLGENLVSGKMTAQQYLVKGYIIDSEPAQPLLSKDEVLTLAEMAKKAEELFGMPQDLEWAIDEYGTICWLQARPITTGETVAIDELDCKYDPSGQVFTTGNIGEVMPGAVTPLNLSTGMYALDWGVKEAFAQLGCISRDCPDYYFIAPFSNHLFFNMTTMYLVNGCVYGTSKENTDLSICGMVLEGFPGAERRLSTFKRILNTIPFIKMVFDGKSPKRNMDKVIAALKFDLTQDADGIYRQILGNFELLKLANLYHYHASFYSGGQVSFLTTALLKDFPDRSSLQSAIAGCLTQIDDFESANILRMMTSLARLIVSENPDAVNYSQTQLMKYIDSEASAKVRSEYDSFMERHGHRGIREMEMRSPSWKSNRMSFFSSLKSVLISLDNESSRHEKQWTEYAEELMSKYNGSKRKRVQSFILKARNGVCLREYTKSRVVYAIDQYKQAYAQLAKLMTESGILPEEDIIYFLLQDEVGRLLAGDRTLVKKAIARRRIFSKQEKLSYPYVSLGTPKPVSEFVSNGNETVLNGTPVSRGTATGRARVVHNEADASRLENGEIMIAACTDVGWTPYYNVIAGMVAEIGSSLSHGIVVAREYSLPAVVNVPDAMKTIKNGDLITIDGDNGTVTIEKRNS